MTAEERKQTYKNLESIIKGDKDYEASDFALGLLLTRLKIAYSLEQTSEEMIKCLEEINAFVEKYSDMLQKEIEKIGLL